MAPCTPHICIVDVQSASLSENLQCKSGVFRGPHKTLTFLGICQKVKKMFCETSGPSAPCSLHQITLEDLDLAHRRKVGELNAPCQRQEERQGVCRHSRSGTLRHLGCHWSWHNLGSACQSYHLVQCCPTLCVSLVALHCPSATYLI